MQTAIKFGLSVQQIYHKSCGYQHSGTQIGRIGRSRNIGANIGQGPVAGTAIGDSDASDHSGVVDGGCGSSTRAVAHYDDPGWRQVATAAVGYVDPSDHSICDRGRGQGR